MQSFQDFLAEKVYFSFKSAIDKDFPVLKDKSYIVFNEEDDYKKQGKTHGSASHAIFHLREFKPEFFDSSILIAKSLIQGMKYTIRNGRKLKNSTIINTLDRINDKFTSKQTLTNEETVLMEKCIRPIQRTYLDICIDMQKRVDMNDPNIEVHIKEPKTYIYDKLTSGVLILKKGSMLTLHKRNYNSYVNLVS